MSYRISIYLPYACLLTALSCNSLAAEATRAARGPMARQTTAADLNAEFARLEQEVNAEVLSAKQPQQVTRFKNTTSATRPQDLSADHQLVAQYTEIIRDVVASHWAQPPGARKDAQVVIHMRLAPTGHIISSAVDQSSGDRNFDHSVLQAVEKAERFPELQDLPLAVFERDFRDVLLLFRPADLLR